MVLDAKALTWAARNNIDTAKLKAAKVPIYGKWYFPEIPAGVALVNLETGEQQVFRQRMVAGEVIHVPAADLQRAGLAPAEFSVLRPGGVAQVESGSIRALAPEPLLAMARPVGLPRQTAIVPADSREMAAAADVDLAGIHMPSPSIAPLVLGVGFCILLLGVITNPIILVVGGLWMLAGAIGWIRIGLLEDRALHGDHAAVEAEHTP